MGFLGLVGVELGLGVGEGAALLTDLGLTSTLEIGPCLGSRT